MALNLGKPQTYGTQIQCGRRGGPPVEATPIADRAGVEERRANVGLEPFTEYLATMRRICRG